MVLRSGPDRVGAGTEAGRHQDLRCSERSGGHDDLTSCSHRLGPTALLVVNPDGPSLIEAHLEDVCAGSHIEVGSVEVRVDERCGDAVALAVLLRHLVQAQAFLLGAVEVGVGRKTGVAKRLAIRTRQQRIVTDVDIVVPARLAVRA